MRAHHLGSDNTNESRAKATLEKLRGICTTNPDCGFSGEEIEHLTQTFEEILQTSVSNRKVHKEELKMAESLKTIGQDASAYMITMFQSHVTRNDRGLTASTLHNHASAAVEGDATRVVGHLIICKPSSSNIETTKGEKLLGRRRVVGGYMLKKGETTKNWTSASVKRRYFVLDGDELSYYRAESEITDDGAQMKLINLKEVTSLRPTTDESAPALAIDLTVESQSTGAKRTFVFAPEGTDEEITGWAERIAESCPNSAVDSTIATMSRETLTLAPSGKSTSEATFAHVVAKGRVLEGWMFKKGETSKPWTAASVKRRYFVLQGSYLKYFATDHMVNSQAPIKTIDLTQATFLGYTRDNTAPGAAMDLKVRLPSGFERIFVFSPVGDASQRISWATNLAEAVPRVALDSDLEQLLNGFVDDDEGLSDSETGETNQYASGSSMLSDTSAVSASPSCPVLPVAEAQENGVSHQGWMFKKGNTTRSWKKASVKKRFFVLQGSELSYYENPSNLLSNSQAKGIIQLDQVRSLCYTADKTAPPLAMDVEVSLPSGGTRVYTLSPAGEDWTQSSWGAIIREKVPQSAVDEHFKEGTQAVDAHLKKKSTKMRSPVDRAQSPSKQDPSPPTSPETAARAMDLKVHRTTAASTSSTSSLISSSESSEGAGLRRPAASSGAKPPRATMKKGLARLSMRVMRPSKRFTTARKDEDGQESQSWTVQKKAAIGEGDEDDEGDEPLEDTMPPERRSTLTKFQRTSLAKEQMGALLKEDEIDADGAAADDDQIAPLDPAALPIHTVSRSRVLSTDEVTSQYRDSPLVRICEISSSSSDMSKLARHAQRLDDWDFDVFALGEITKHPLVFVAYSLLSGFDMINSFKLDEAVLETFLKTIEATYTDTPYHCALHAADVTQNLNYFVAKCGLSTAARLSQELLLSCILTPVIHDVGHFGVNNPFLIASEHHLAITYNDQSPMENMHCATAFTVMGKEGHDVLATLSPQTKKDVRFSMIQMVLATDNKHHLKYLSEFDNKIDEDECDFDNWEDQILVLQIALHAADVANPAKPRPLYKQWTERIMKEFYSQGDKELEQGMPVTPFLDRRKPIPEERFQSGFIKAIVQPLYQAFSRVDGLDLRVPLKTLELNLKWYQDIIDGQQ